MMAANVMTPVPWMSSLKQATSGLYLSSILRALVKPKSSLSHMSSVSGIQARAKDAYKCR